jgi:hypothetical protein
MSRILPIWTKAKSHPFITPKKLPPFISGDWNTMTKWVFDQGSFTEACIARMNMDRDNAVIIEGERGEGKTNVLLWFIEYFNLYFGNSYSVDRNIYLGRDVDLTVNWIAEDFRNQPNSAIGIDESEIPFSKYTAITIQNREAKIFMDVFRELKLLIFFVCPDKDILDSRIVDRCNWNIICDWNDMDKKQVEVTVEYYGKLKDRTKFRWLRFEDLIIPYVDEAYYHQLRAKKHSDLYSKDGLKKDFHATRKQKLAQMRKDVKVELALKRQEVVDSKLTLTDKIIELLRLETPKYSVVTLLKKEGATISRINLAEHYLHLQGTQTQEESKKEMKKKTS